MGFLPIKSSFQAWSGPAMGDQNERKGLDRSDDIGGMWCLRKVALTVASPLNLERELGAFR